MERRPAHAQVFVALSQPARWLDALGRLTSWLSDLPELSARLRRWQGALTDWLGAWPPHQAHWAQIGLDPGGGLLLAAVERPSQGGRHWWFAALATEPMRLLGVLAGKTVRQGTQVRAELPGGLVLHCVAEPDLVECATCPSLLGGAPVPRPWPGPEGEILVAIRGQGWQLRVAMSHGGSGLGVKAHLVGREVEDLASLLASPLSLPEPPRGGMVAAFGRVDPSKLVSLLGWIPKGHASLVPEGGPPVPLVSLLSTAGGTGWLALGAWGLRLELTRTGGPEPFAEVTAVTLGGRHGLFARTDSETLVVGTSPAALAPSLSLAGRARPLAGPFPTGTAPLASAALWVLLTDPLEWLPETLRVRVVAAIMGLGENERALVAAVRALLTALGEVTLVARPHRQGLALEVTQRSPWAGSEPLERAFRTAWRDKWRTGGFFAPEALASLERKHPDSAAGALARGLAGLRLPRAWREAYLDLLLFAVHWLRGPEVSCALLSARLSECEEAFAREIDPKAWQRADRLSQLGADPGWPAELLEEGRRSASMLITRCDALAGRMEAAGAVQACLVLGNCGTTVSCLVGVFSPWAGESGRSLGSPR